MPCTYRPGLSTVRIGISLLMGNSFVVGNRPNASDRGWVLTPGLLSHGEQRGCTNAEGRSLSAPPFGLVSLPCYAVASWRRTYCRIPPLR
ncbi:hypothetical protein ACFPRL_00850 [Pseudoclavibacter helvolus]